MTFSLPLLILAPYFVSRNEASAQQYESKLSIVFASLSFILMNTGIVMA